MPKQNQPVEPVDLKTARLKANFDQLTQRWNDTSDVFVRLCRRLQISLDPNRLLDCFSEELSQLVAFDSLVYSYEQHPSEFVYSIGYGGHHGCDYQLVLEGENLGGLKINRRQRFIDQELVVIEQLIGLLVISLRNAWHFQNAQSAALTDVVTGLGNRRQLDQELERELHRTQRHSGSFALIVCDLDHFKRVNDNYGHPVGDVVLVQVAKILGQCTRTSDACYRIGGEEFAILLPNTDLGAACVVAERIRSTVSEAAFGAVDAPLNVTLSAGVTSFLEADSAAALIKRADAAMYLAKQSGRNCVVSDASALAAYMPA